MQEYSTRSNTIVGQWDFRNGNVCTFTQKGDVDLHGQRIGLWKHDSDRKYILTYPARTR